MWHSRNTAGSVALKKHNCVSDILCTQLCLWHSRRTAVSSYDKTGLCCANSKSTQSWPKILMCFALQKAKLLSRYRTTFQPKIKSFLCLLNIFLFAIAQHKEFVKKEVRDAGLNLFAKMCMNLRKKDKLYTSYWDSNVYA